MLCVSGTIYASAFCFLFAGKAAEYVDKYYECIRAITGDRFGTPTNDCLYGTCSWLLILSFVGTSKEEAQAVIGENLNLAGGLCIACSILLIVSLHASTVLSGYVMMTRRIMLWCNLLTFALSAVGDSYTHLLVIMWSQPCFQGLAYHLMPSKRIHLLFHKALHFPLFAFFFSSSSSFVHCMAVLLHTRNAFAFLSSKLASAFAVWYVFLPSP